MYQERTIPQRNLRDATIHRAAKRDTCKIQVSMPQLHCLEPSVPTLAPHRKKHDAAQGFQEADIIEPGRFSRISRL
jgi:hypothetical protein